MTAALEGGEWSAARPGRTLPPGKNRYPFYRRLGGPQGRSGRAENLVPTGIRSRTVQPVVSRCTDWATRPTHCKYKPSKHHKLESYGRKDYWRETLPHSPTRTGKTILNSSLRIKNYPDEIQTRYLPWKQITRAITGLIRQIMINLTEVPQSKLVDAIANIGKPYLSDPLSHSHVHITFVAISPIPTSNSKSRKTSHSNEFLTRSLWLSAFR